MSRKAKKGPVNPIKEFTMYFVYSCPTDKEDLNMSQAFETCTSSNLKPEWISEKSAHQLSAKSTTVFVLKQFKGEIFDFLSSKSCLVCGPRCIHECVSKKLPVPENQSPVFNTAMLGVVVTSTQVAKQKKEEIKKLVGYMGGSYTDILCMAVTHLVSDRGMSAKCEKASEIDIPIMMTSWVDAVWNEALLHQVSATDPKFDKYRMPPFYGLEITCSNLPRDIKMEIKDLIESNGGICSGKMVQFSTSVLVIGEPESDKYKHAQMWNIPCVVPSWIFDSVKRKIALPPKDYTVKPKPKCSTPTKSSELPSFMNSTDISVVTAGDLTKSEVNDTMSSIVSMKSIKRPKKPLENPGSNYKKFIDQINLSEMKSAGLFLDGCKIYLSGFTNQETEKLKKVLNIGGATIFTQISDRLSHIVVGDFVASEAKAFSQLQPRPHIVSVEWILASMKQRCPVGVQPYLCLESENALVPPPSPLSHKGLELLKSVSSDQEAPDRSLPVSRKLFVKNKKAVANIYHNETQLPELEPEPVPEKRSDADSSIADKEIEPIAKGPEESKNVTMSSEIESLGPGCFFQGLLFELVNIPEPEQATDAIKTAGGSVISGRDGVPDYAVVPIEGTTTKVNAAEVVTVLWIEDCFDQNKVADVMYYHQPLSFKVGRQPLAGTALCVSGYVGSERTFISYVASILGASVQELFSRRDHPNKGILKATHLICNEPTGSKYSAAIKWGVPIVTKSWILKCAASGKQEPIELYTLSPNPVANSDATPSTNKFTASDFGSGLKKTLSSSSFLIAQTPNKKVTEGEMGPPQSSGTPREVTEPKSAVEPMPAESTVKVDASPGGAEMVSPYNLIGRRHSDSTPKCAANTTPTTETRPRSLESGKSLIITKRKVTPSNSQTTSSKFNDYDDDDLEFELGIRSKKHQSGLSSKDETYQTPSVLRRISSDSPGPSPFHIDTPDSPYGQVFTDNPSPATRKKWKRYIDTFPDLYEGSPVLRERRLSTPLSLIKKQLLVKFGGAEIDGIDPETGDLLPEGQFKQWAKGNISDDSDQNYCTPETSSHESGVNSNRKSSLAEIEKYSEKKLDYQEKIKPKVLGVISKENTPLSVRKNAKKFVRKVDLNASKVEETPVSKLLAPQFQRIPEIDLMEKYKNFDANNEITEEMRKRLSNRFKPTTQDSDDADNPLKETLKRDVEGSVTWDIERPQYLEKMMERELAKKAAEKARLSDERTRMEDGSKMVVEETEPDEPVRRFTLSSIQQGNREKYESIIKNLGSEVSNTLHYDPNITHIVIDKPIRSEKLLCSIASGKWVLHVSYLDQCYESRQFLPEDDYEWGNPRSLARLPTVAAGSQEALLARAAYWWRHRVSELGNRSLPFSNFKAALFTMPNKTPQYTRLLQAGGATILERENILEATHCFVDVGKVDFPMDMSQLVKREIHCIPPVYLGDYLSKIPAPQPHEYWLDDYKKAAARLRNAR